jgi:hypothetical protein
MLCEIKETNSRIVNYLKFNFLCTTKVYLKVSVTSI